MNLTRAGARFAAPAFFGGPVYETVFFSGRIRTGYRLWLVSLGLARNLPGVIEMPKGFLSAISTLPCQATVNLHGKCTGVVAGTLHVALGRHGMQSTAESEQARKRGTLH